MSLNGAPLNSHVLNGSAEASFDPNSVFVSEGAGFSDEFDADIFLDPSLVKMMEGAEFGDAAGTDIVVPLVEASAFSDVLPPPQIIVPLVEKLQLSTLVFGRTNYTLALTDMLPLFDRAQPILSAAMADAAELGDDYTARTLFFASLVESLIASEVVTARRDAIAVVALAMTLADAAASMQLAELIEALQADDTLATRLIANAALTEAMTLAVSVSAGRVLLVTLPEHLVLDAAATARATYSALIEELVGTEAEFLIAGEVYQGWVVDTRTGAPTEYENYPFNSMCRIGQRYYGAAEDGLYLLDGDTDDGDPIRARVVTGEMDFGSPNLKRVERAYFGYATSGDMVMKVIVTHAGKRSEYWYKAAALPVGESTETRVKVGEGIVSRYWQFELVNTDGADFEIDRWDIDVRDLKRRV